MLALWVVLTLLLRERIVRPLQTLSNMLAGLREGDFSIRARVGDADDPLSLAYLEVNNLEEILREQRLGAVGHVDDGETLSFDATGGGRRTAGVPAQGA